MTPITKLKELQIKANQIRHQILEIIAGANKGHIGGAFSCIDILTALYYGGILSYHSDNPNWELRDRFILSKGHSVIALYAILADLGFFPKSALDTFGKNGTILGGHPSQNISGIEADTGSLGHGLGIASGMALAAKLDNKDFMTVVLLGDGECYEGSVWEAAQFAGFHRLNNLVAIVDRNCQCATDFTEDCLGQEPFADKWNAFNWDVREVDGHSLEELIGLFESLRERQSQRPIAVIAHTIKGKGVSFMERRIEWHHSVPKGDQLIQARREIHGRSF